MSYHTILYHIILYHIIKHCSRDIVCETHRRDRRDPGEVPTEARRLQGGRLRRSRQGQTRRDCPDPSPRGRKARWTGPNPLQNHSLTNGDGDWPSQAGSNPGWPSNWTGPGCVQRRLPDTLVDGRCCSCVNIHVRRKNIDMNIYTYHNTSLEPQSGAPSKMQQINT